jgi:outer membrane protein assembly factor BamB
VTRRLSAFLLALACAVVVVPARAGAPACDWPRYGHDIGLSFSQTSACTSLNAVNAALMIPKWYAHGPDSMSASVSLSDGVIYVGNWDGTMFALDAATGKHLWTFKVDDDHTIAFGRIVSTAAVDTITIPGAGKQKVVLFGGGATLYALAAGRTGPRLLAKIDTDPRTPALRAKQANDPPEIEIESSPLVGHLPDGDRIYIGNDVHNNDHVGRTGLMAFSLRKATSGPLPLAFTLLYKFDAERQVVLHSMTDGSGTGWGCGDIWSSPALNPHAGRNGVVVFGTGNCDHPDQSVAAGEVGREGMFAIDAKTGAMLWRFHPRPAQDVDDDFGASPNLLDGGRAVGEGGKDGWYYKLDLLTGKLLWRAHGGESGHVQTGFAVGGFIGTPAVGVATGKPAIFGAIAISTPIKNTLDDGRPQPDGTLLTDPTRLFSLVAIDAATGRILWRAPMPPSYGAVTYANGVVLMADTFSLTLNAFDASTGAPLAVRPIPGPPSSAPVIAGDTIYVSIGTSETDLEFKAFSHRLEDLFAGTVGESPLSPLSGVIAYKLPV